MKILVQAAYSGETSIAKFLLFTRFCNQSVFRGLKWTEPVLNQFIGYPIKLASPARLIFKTITWTFYLQKTLPKLIGIGYYLPFSDFRSNRCFTLYFILFLQFINLICSYHSLTSVVGWRCKWFLIWHA